MAVERSKSQTRRHVCRAPGAVARAAKTERGMTMAKYKRLSPDDGDWSEWIDFDLLATGHREGCCDCGMVHDVDFEISKLKKKNPDGSCDYEPVDPAKFLLRKRVKRNNRATGQIRRHMKKEEMK